MKKVFVVILGIAIYVVPLCINPNKLSDKERIILAVTETVAICLFVVTIAIMYSTYLEKWRKSEEE